MIRRGAAHSCHGKMPYPYTCRNGSVWMCDDCGKFWIKRFGDRQTYGFQHGHWLRIVNPLRIWWLKRASK